MLDARRELGGDLGVLTLLHGPSAGEGTSCCVPPCWQAPCAPCLTPWTLPKHAGTMFLLSFSLLLASHGAWPSGRCATQEREHMWQHPQPSQDGVPQLGILVPISPLVPTSPRVPTGPHSQPALGSEGGGGCVLHAGGVWGTHCCCCWAELDPQVGGHPFGTAGHVTGWPGPGGWPSFFLRMTLLSSWMSLSLMGEGG